MAEGEGDGRVGPQRWLDGAVAGGLLQERRPELEWMMGQRDGEDQGAGLGRGGLDEKERFGCPPSDTRG